MVALKSKGKKAVKRNAGAGKAKSGSLKRILLVVRDGWGAAPSSEGNCVSLAKIPNHDYYSKNFPHSILKASGEAVGLPAGSQGNSEVGHLHMGAGRVIWQPYELINRSIRSGSFFRNKALLGAIKNCKDKKSSLHFMGLFSDEGVHGTTNHLLALIDLAVRNKVDFFVHCFLDGRDVHEKSAQKYIDLVEKKMASVGRGRIASMIGRYYAMDRDNNYERTKKAYDLLVKGEGIPARNPSEGLAAAYASGVKTDYYVEPIVVTGKDGKPVATIKDNDSVVFYNFRTDRPKELSHAFLDKDFTFFKRNVFPKTFFVTFTEYDKSFACPAAFKEPVVNENLGKIFSKKGYSQLRISETEKRAHVSYFFNSQVEEPYPGEERVVIPSLEVPIYDSAPEMSAREIARVAVERIKSGKYDFVLVNFANCDVVGHSANIPAIVHAVETVDECTGKVVSAALEKDYLCFITADHGSAEEKLYPNGEHMPSHSTNPVDFFIISKERIPGKMRDGSLTDVAPTILKLAGIKKPREMTGEPLI